MNTPHERLTRTTFSLLLGEVNALGGGAVNARPLLFLHGFPDHPPTAVPFLEHLAETHRVVAPWLRGYAPLSDRRPLRPRHPRRRRPRPDRSPVARLVAELHARLRAPRSTARTSPRRRRTVRAGVGSPDGGKRSKFQCGLQCLKALSRKIARPPRASLIYM